LRVLVAHEPPAIGLLPDSARHRAAIEDVHDTYLSSGIGPAMQKFLAASGLGGEGGREPAGPDPRREPTPEMAGAMAEMEQNLDFFFAYYALAVTTYEPDLAALRAGSTTIVVGVGRDSKGNLAHLGGLALAERLGTHAVVFPGDHGGYMRQPHEFAATLRQVLAVS
jgi:hypothetical protein